MDATTRQQLSDFFTAHENEAYRMAWLMTGNRDDALEIVQESMMKLVRSYSKHASEEWRLLLFRILQNQVRDYFRRQSVRKILLPFFSRSQNDEDESDLDFADDPGQGPEQNLQSQHELERIHGALTLLPRLQQQTFLLRAWQEFSTRETAYALSITEASVKTHYSQALRQLRGLLGESNGY